MYKTVKKYELVQIIRPSQMLRIVSRHNRPTVALMRTLTDCKPLRPRLNKLINPEEEQFIKTK